MAELKDEIIYRLFEEDVNWLPSYIRLLKTDPQYRREIYSICRDNPQLQWLANEFKTDLIMDYLNDDRV